MDSQYPDIIPFDSWINSQLSVAKHYWGITLNGKTYVVDYILAEENEDRLCKPDLVEEKLHKKMLKENKAKVKAYNDECKRLAKEASKNTSLWF